MSQPASIEDRWAIDEELDLEFPRQIHDTPTNRAPAILNVSLDDIVRMTGGFGSTGPEAHLPGKHDQSTHGRGRGMSAAEFDLAAESAVSGPDVSAAIPINPNSPDLNAAGREALMSYMGTGFEGVNDALRRGRRPDRRTKKVIAAIDDAMRSSPIGDDVVVWRGMGTGGVFGDRLGEDLTDFSWTERAYVSTSFHRNTGEIFATAQSESPGVLIRMVAPRGLQAVELYGGEGEALLQRDLGMRVVRDHGLVQITPPDAFGRPFGPPQQTRVLDVEVIP